MNPITGFFAALGRLRTAANRLADRFEAMADEVDARLLGQEEPKEIEVEPANGRRRVAAK